MHPPQAQVLDGSKYHWKQSHDDPSLWQREALAGENLWSLRPKEIRELFLWGKLLLFEPIEVAHIFSAAQEAWKELRNLHPEIILTARIQNDGKRLLEFHVPQSDHGIEQWVARTLITGASSGDIGFTELQNTINKRKPRADDSALLCLHVEITNSDEDVIRIGFSLNIDHLCTNGIGIRIIAGHFLRLFAHKLSLGGHGGRTELKWQDSASKLSPPWTSIMNKNQMTSGVEFDEAVSSQFHLLRESANNWGLSLLTQPNLRPSGSDFHFLSLTKSQSISLLRAVKSKLGSTGTITHLCHAAVVLAIIRNCPMSPSDEPNPLITPCIMNGRRYLLSLLSPEQTYVPICQATGVVCFPNLHDYTVSANSARSDLVKVLKAACEDAKKSYDAIKARESILSESVALIEHWGDEKHESQKSGRPKKIQERAEPIFLSDGIGEQYIDRTYSANGSQVFSVEDLRFGGNAEGPNLCVRLSTWRDVMTISGEWRREQYAREVVERYLGDVVSLMLLLLDED